jgi:hypothetical protein
MVPLYSFFWGIVMLNLSRETLANFPISPDA